MKSLLAVTLTFTLIACRHSETDGAGPPRTIGSIERLDPRLDKLIPPGARMEIIAEGHEWTEGPVWVNKDGGFLLYSDIPRNSIYKWREGEGAALWLKPAGYTGQAPRGGEPGTNGLTLDPKGRLVMCQHGDRRVARLGAPLDKPEPKFVTLAERYEGKRFNSPNDLVYHKNGDLYFTDPPYGLEKQMEDPAKELPFQGVYRLSPDGKVTLLTRDITRPNGIGLSPDGKTLYVANSDPKKAVWMVFDVTKEGVANGRIMHDSTARVGKEPGLPDGLSVDRGGNIFATGPGGVLVFAPDGKHLGTLHTTQATANCCFGDDGWLYITADMYILRIKTNTRGVE